MNKLSSTCPLLVDVILLSQFQSNVNGNGPNVHFIVSRPLDVNSTSKSKRQQKARASHLGHTTVPQTLKLVQWTRSTHSNTMDAPDPNTLRSTPEQSDNLFPAERLTTAEKWWRDHYELLKQRGYLLRPRYQPNWSPSPNSGKPGLRWGQSDEFIGLPVCHKPILEPFAGTVNRDQT
jgi:hypothetical protein